MLNSATLGLARAADMRDMVKSGEFVKIGKKHYEHAATGINIKFDCNRWMWEIVGKEVGFCALHAAVSRVRYMTAQGEW